MLQARGWPRAADANEFSSVRLALGFSRVDETNTTLDGLARLDLLDTGVTEKSAHAAPERWRGIAWPV